MIGKGPNQELGRGRNPVSARLNILQHARLMGGLVCPTTRIRRQWTCVVDHPAFRDEHLPVRRKGNIRNRIGPLAHVRVSGLRYAVDRHFKFPLGGARIAETGVVDADRPDSVLFGQAVRAAVLRPDGVIEASLVILHGPDAPASLRALYEQTASDVI